MRLHSILKKAIVPTLLLLVILTALSPAGAEEIFRDPIFYEPGVLDGSGNWSVFDNNTSAFNIVSDSLAYTDSASKVLGTGGNKFTFTENSGEFIICDIDNILEDSSQTVATYVSFLAKCTGLPSATGGYFAGFHYSSTATSSF